MAVTDAYRRAGAVTQEHPVLEAAHIGPYAQGGMHEVNNGLLLRSDLHRLFDLGDVTVTPDLHLEVSGRLRGNSRMAGTYYPFHGRKCPFRPSLLYTLTLPFCAGTMKRCFASRSAVYEEAS